MTPGNKKARKTSPIGDEEEDEEKQKEKQ